MVALDLDPAEVAQVGPQTSRDLQRVCSLCESKRRCVRDLTHDSAAPVWQDYCPNAQTLHGIGRAALGVAARVVTKDACWPRSSPSRGFTLAIPAVIFLGSQKAAFPVASGATPLLALYLPALEAAALLLPIVICQDAISVHVYGAI